MFKEEKSVVIEAPVEQVFAYLINPAHMTEYAVDINVIEVKDIQHLPNGGYSWTAISSVLGLHIEGKGQHTEVVPNERLVAKAHSSVADFNQVGRLERLGDNKTRLTVTDEITIHKGGALAKFGEGWLAKYIDHGGEAVMAALKARIEAETLAATPR